MTQLYERYTYHLTWSEDDQAHIGLCAELPSLSWLDTSPKKALSGIRELVKSCLKELAKNKEQAPEPDSH
jgi:hypothetical protein